MDKRILLAKAIEKQFFITAGRIESSLNRFDIRIIVLHVVGEYHQLRDVNKTTKNLSGEAGIDAVMFGYDAILVVGLFDLHKGQGHTIDQQNDIRPKFIIPIPVCQFCYNMVSVAGTVFKINQTDTVDSVEQDIVKRLAKIFV